MKKVVNYIVVNGDGINDIGRRVMDYIKDGWQPFEKPFIYKISESASNLWAQALVKYEDDK